MKEKDLRIDQATLAQALAQEQERSSQGSKLPLDNRPIVSTQEIPISPDTSLSADGPSVTRESEIASPLTQSLELPAD